MANETTRLHGRPIGVAIHCVNGQMINRVIDMHNSPRNAARVFLLLFAIILCPF
jgi:hypothetical protein